MLKNILLVYFIFGISLLYAQAPHQEKTQDSLVVANIFIDCHRKTKDGIILRELALKKGSKIAKTELQKILDKESQKIFNTDLFIFAKVLPMPLRQDSLDILVDVLEKWYFYPIPIIELADRNFTEWWQQRNADLSRINYGINFRQQNVRGRNEDLRVLLQFGFTQKIGVEYIIPYINGKQTTGLNFNISYSENRDVGFNLFQNQLIFSKGLFNEREEILFRKFSSEINLSKREHFYNVHTFSAGYHYLQTHDSVTFYNPKFFPNKNRHLQYLAVGYEFLRDMRDAAPYPLRGLYLKLDITQKGLGISNFHQTHLEGVFAKFTPLAKNFFWASSLRGGLVLPQEQPFAELRTFGFRRNYLRGYELYALDATRFLIFKNTFRYQVFNIQRKIPFIPLEQFNTVPIALYAKIFADTGYAYKKQVNDDDFLSRRLLGSLGAGADLVTYYNMVFRFEYSWNHRGESGFFMGIQSDF